MLKELDKRNIDFKIIFRTFGNDISNVAKELNNFCEGNHVLNNKNSEDCVYFDGRNGKADRRLILPKFCGSIKRFNNSKGGLHFGHVTEDNVFNFNR